MHFSYKDQQSSSATSQLHTEVRMCLALSFLQTACLCPTFSRALTWEGIFWLVVLSWLHIVSIKMDALLWCVPAETQESKPYGAHHEYWCDFVGAKLHSGRQWCYVANVGLVITLRLTTLYPSPCSLACPRVTVISRFIHSSFRISLCLVSERPITFILERTNWVVNILRLLGFWIGLWMSL